MALRGWRLVGLASTLVVYVGGILLLSVVSLNSPNQRRTRTGRFGEVNQSQKYYISIEIRVKFKFVQQFDAFRRNEVNMVAKRQPLRWCQPLRYLGQDETIPPRTTTASPTHPAALPFQRLPPDYFRAPIAEPFQDSISEILPRPPDNPSKTTSTNLHFDDDRIKSKSNNHQSNVKNNGEADDSSSGMHGSRVHLWPKSGRNRNQKITTNRDRKQRLKDEAAAAAAVEASQHNLIALASFPGSGNTWLRYLLQQATGIGDYKYKFLINSKNHHFKLLKSFNLI